ncbi:hypothetical protein SAMN05443572_102875 [Myxococcus fulvus]|uniref:Uncharacterized protein n=1 Tax=Myxococcus fulvus TaxID=33 RepID=A0ABY1C3L4_MYXFU|nr:hypothetical protein SAMN05443572_102875 [Myxococcus fulvus]
MGRRRRFRDALHGLTEDFAADLAQCVGDKLDKGTGPAEDTLVDTVYGELKAGREVHLMGYSQGGFITARPSSRRAPDSSDAHRARVTFHEGSCTRTGPSSFQATVHPRTSWRRKTFEGSASTTRVAMDLSRSLSFLLKSLQGRNRCEFRERQSTTPLQPPFIAWS